MRGLLALFFAFAFTVTLKLAARALRRSERYGRWAEWCHRKADELSEPRL